MKDVKSIIEGTETIYSHIYGDHYKFSERSMKFSTETILEDIEFMNLRKADLNQFSIFNVGTGREAYCFQILGAKNVFHADISTFAVEAIRTLVSNKKIDNIQTEVCDLCAAPPRDQKGYDLAYLNGVVHHFYAPYQGVLNVSHGLNENGHLFIRIYSSGSFLFFVVSIIREFIARNEFSYFLNNSSKLKELCIDDFDFEDMYDDLFVPELHLFNPHQLNEMLKKVGLYLVASTYPLEASYDHAAGSKKSFLGLHFIKKKSGILDDSYNITFDSVDQLRDICYRESYINDTLSIYESCVRAIVGLSIAKRAALVCKLYRLCHSSNDVLSDKERHTALQTLIFEASHER